MKNLQRAVETSLEWARKSKRLPLLAIRRWFKRFFGWLEFFQRKFGHFHDRENDIYRSARVIPTISILVKSWTSWICYLSTRNLHGILWRAWVVYYTVCSEAAHMTPLQAFPRYFFKLKVCFPPLSWWYAMIYYQMNGSWPELNNIKYISWMISVV